MNTEIDWRPESSLIQSQFKTLLLLLKGKFEAAKYLWDDSMLKSAEEEITNASIKVATRLFTKLLASGRNQ